MFYLNKATELDAALLYKMLNRFHITVLPKLEKYKNYYDGIQAILRKTYPDPTKPCSRAVTNYCKNIVDSYCGYLATPGYISYISEDDIEEIMNILRYNDFQAEDSDFLLQALIYGVSAELMYLDSAGKTRFKLINPTSCFGVYDDSLTGDLIYFVRWYKVSDWDDSNLYNVDVYSDTHVKHYTMSGWNGSLTLVGEEPHYFSQCPANIFYLPDEKSIFDCVIDLQDSANELANSEIDDFSAFCDAYMVWQGMDADDADMDKMKHGRLLILPEGAEAKWLTKSASDAQVENMIQRTREDIYRIAACPDYSSEAFNSGVTSGAALKYRLVNMETRAGKIEAEMKKALQRRIEIICGIASLKLGEEVFRDIAIEFKRNVPKDYTEIINLINGLKGTVSDETLLGQLDFIEDPAAEVEKNQAQKKANLTLYPLAGNLVTGAEEEIDE